VRCVQGDLRVNVCKTKVKTWLDWRGCSCESTYSDHGNVLNGILLIQALTNMRSAGKDKDEGLKAPLDLSLDAAIEYIADDEMVEVTPLSIRMCKKPGWDSKKNKKA